ncbi:MAG TPA: stage III sporulation protein AA [Clostridiaceae bacterium]|nr:stage III sporulation protein AA [Clostridiaceae bacterium]
MRKTVYKNPVKGILPYVSQGIRDTLGKVDKRVLESAEEIRLRADKPLIIQQYLKEWFVSKSGKLEEFCSDPYIVERSEISKTVEIMSENSIYAYQDEIKNGFITLKGGHRVGLAGKVVLDGGSIKNIKYISGLNIRISREIPGCSDHVINYILNKKGGIYNTLIISPPQCGKTTILRDLARKISDGISEAGLKGMKVGIVDERSEIAACYKGVPQNNVGIRTDVMDGCPKSLGMCMMIRSMSPQVIITDEIGGQGDKDAIMSVINAGVKIIATAHGYNLTELKSRREVIGLMEEKVFERFLVLNNSKGPGTLAEVIDGLTYNVLYKGG